MTSTLQRIEGETLRLEITFDLAYLGSIPFRISSTVVLNTVGPRSNWRQLFVKCCIHSVVYNHQDTLRDHAIDGAARVKIFTLSFVPQSLAGQPLARQSRLQKSLGLLTAHRHDAREVGVSRGFPGSRAQCVWDLQKWWMELEVAARFIPSVNKRRPSEAETSK